jgi:hypothetical protein
MTGRPYFPSMTLADYGRALAAMHCPDYPLAVRIAVAAEASAFEDLTHGQTVEAGIRYLYPARMQAKFNHYAAIAEEARAFLKQMQE